MTWPVVITPEAQQNLREAAGWWARHRSAAQAQRWYDGFVEALDSLAEQPLRCPLARENESFPYELRELPYGVGSRPTHRALFAVRPDAVVVLSIRHVAQKDVAPDDLPAV
jgi:plasmid stabilization system protein ParE